MNHNVHLPGHHIAIVQSNSLKLQSESNDLKDMPPKAVQKEIIT